MVNKIKVLSVVTVAVVLATIALFILPQNNEGVPYQTDNTANPSPIHTQKERTENIPLKIVNTAMSKDVINTTLTAIGRRNVNLVTTDQVQIGAIIPNADDEEIKAIESSLKKQGFAAVQDWFERFDGKILTKCDVQNMGDKVSIWCKSEGF